MQRITSKLHDFAPAFYVNKEGKHLTPAELSVGQTREVLQRLCEYEETRLSPDEILELKKKSADTKTKNPRKVKVYIDNLLIEGFEL